MQRGPHADALFLLLHDGAFDFAPPLFFSLSLPPEKASPFPTLAVGRWNFSLLSRWIPVRPFARAGTGGKLGSSPPFCLFFFYQERLSRAPLFFFFFQRFLISHLEHTRCSLFFLPRDCQTFFSCLEHQLRPRHRLTRCGWTVEGAFFFILLFSALYIEDFVAASRFFLPSPSEYSSSSASPPFFFLGVGLMFVPRP